jgi:hypothetical protein
MIGEDDADVGNELERNCQEKTDKDFSPAAATLSGTGFPSAPGILFHVYGPNQAHGVQQPRVWLPASTLEPGSRAAAPRRRLHPELRPNSPSLQSQARALQARAMAPEIFGCARAGGRGGGGRGKARVTAPSSRHSSLL